MNTFDKIEAFRAREQEIEYDKEKLLRSLGWEYSSSYPDFRWRWSKMIRGARVTEDTTGALQLESYLCEEQ